MAKYQEDGGLNLLALLIVVLFAVFGAFITRLMHGLEWPIFMKKRCKDIPPLITKFKIPDLLLEIIFGAIARNAFLSFMDDNYNDKWGEWVREIALTIILLRGGLELEFQGLGKTVVLLTVVPLIFESFSVALLTWGIFGMTISLAFGLGFIISAVSPAVLVPALMKLQVQNYGVNKGIPITLIAAASFDDVLAITLYGISVIFAINDAKTGEKEAPYMIIVKVIYEIAAGIGVGVFLGLCGYFLRNAHMNIKFAYSVACTIGILLLFKFIHFHESTFLGVILFGYTLHRLWKGEKPDWELEILWEIIQPFLFGTIGGAILIGDLKPDVVGFGILIVLFGLIFRSFATYFVMPKNYNVGEKIFSAVAWVPKATVQAAMGSLVLEEGRNLKSQSLIDHGEKILTISVLSIILTAPVGAIFTATLGPKLLKKTIKKRRRSSSFHSTKKELEEHERRLSVTIANEMHQEEMRKLKAEGKLNGTTSRINNDSVASEKLDERQGTNRSENNDNALEIENRV